jgi:hypothetical protein
LFCFVEKIKEDNKRFLLIHDSLLPDMLSNTISLVTGAGSGIGKRVAQLFASEGSRVCGV